MLSCQESVDLLIPRGSNAFVQYIMDNTKIPVMGHADGICHIYVDKEFDIDKAIPIIIDAKMQYAAACNAVETLLIHKDAVDCLMPELNKAFQKHHIELRATTDIAKQYNSKEATDEDFETEYKYLKAIIEGGLGKKPSNVLIYATSNRRHLIREKFSDKKEILDDLHGNDTVQEKLSLVSRFGVTIYFGAPDKFQFQKIVKVLADRYHIQMTEEELYAEANKWELYHGGLSGRTAAQFITHLLGKKK